MTLGHVARSSDRVFALSTSGSLRRPALEAYCASRSQNVSACILLASFTSSPFLPPAPPCPPEQSRLLVLLSCAHPSELCSGVGPFFQLLRVVVTLSRLPAFLLLCSWRKKKASPGLDLPNSVPSTVTEEQTPRVTNCSLVSFSSFSLSSASSR